MCRWALYSCASISWRTVAARIFYRCTKISLFSHWTTESTSTTLSTISPRSLSWLHWWTSLITIQNTAGIMLWECTPWSCYSNFHFTCCKGCRRARGSNTVMSSYFTRWSGEMSEKLSTGSIWWVRGSFGRNHNIPHKVNFVCGEGWEHSLAVTTWIWGILTATALCILSY